MTFSSLFYFRGVFLCKPNRKIAFIFNGLRLSSGRFSLQITLSSLQASIERSIATQIPNQPTLSPLRQQVVDLGQFLLLGQRFAQLGDEKLVDAGTTRRPELRQVIT
jgi:hypothetical protein